MSGVDVNRSFPIGQWTSEFWGIADIRPTGNGSGGPTMSAARAIAKESEMRKPAMC